jgi:hypothetical protein
MPTTGRTSAIAGQISGSPAANDVAYTFARAGIPFFVPNWITTTAAGDRDTYWIDVSDATMFVMEVVPSGTLTASVQVSTNNGANFFDATPIAGSTSVVTSITAAGIYIFQGPYQVARFKATALSAPIVVSASWVRL